MNLPLQGRQEVSWVQRTMAIMTPEQIVALKHMTPAEKLAMASRFYWSARALKRAGLRSLNPSLSPEELDRKVKEAFLYAAE